MQTVAIPGNLRGLGLVQDFLHQQYCFPSSSSSAVAHAGGKRIQCKQARLEHTHLENRNEFKGVLKAQPLPGRPHFLIVSGLHAQLPLPLSGRLDCS